jgi:hypothetical protein
VHTIDQACAASVRARRTQDVRLMNLNVMQIEYFAPLWVAVFAAENMCTLIVRFVRIQVQRQRLKRCPKCTLDPIPVPICTLPARFAHKFGPLLAFTARFFGIRRTHRWKV